MAVAYLKTKLLFLLLFLFLKTARKYRETGIYQCLSVNCKLIKVCYSDPYNPRNSPVLVDVDVVVFSCTF